ncbi:hypothetical protein ACOSQ2_004241 [Xanthoceras sorbifolium]
MAKRNIIPDADIVSVVIDLIVEENFREYLNPIPSFPTQESTRISEVMDLLVEENFREFLNSIPGFPVQESTRSSNDVSWLTTL